MGGRFESERQALLSRFTLDRIVMGATIANAPAGEQPSNPGANDHVPQSSMGSTLQRIGNAHVAID